MNRLLDIERSGGYPFCAENLKIIEQNSRLVEYIFGAMNMQNRSAIILGAPSISGAMEIGRYMYAKPTAGNGRLVKIASGHQDVSLLTNHKVVFTTNNYSVTNASDVTVADVYQLEVASIVGAGTAAERWTFYKLEDVVEMAKWEDMLSGFTSSLLYSTSPSGTFTSLPSLVGNNNILAKNDKKLRINLQIHFGIKVTSYETALKIPIDLPGVYPLNSVLQGGSTYYPVMCYINDSYIVIKIGKYLEDRGITIPNGGQQCTDDVFINGEVVL